MANLKKYDLSGKAKGDVAIDDALLEVKAGTQSIKDYLVAIRANKRQWSASTQSRGEVSCTKRKPFAQKGTGNARQGFLAAPQFKGGGRVHTPRPKFNQEEKVNKKEKRAAIRSLLAQKVKENQAHILENTKFKEPKTKTFADFLKALSLSGKRVLFLAERGDHKVLAKSLNNLPKVEFCAIEDVNGYDLALSNQLVILESAVEPLKATLGAKK